MAYHTVLAGDVTVEIDGPQKTAVNKKAGSSGEAIYSYTPQSAGEYNINIKAKGKHIHGSPFSAKVSGRNLKLVPIKLPFICSPLI